MEQEEQVEQEEQQSYNLSQYQYQLSSFIDKYLIVYPHELFP